MRGLQVLIQCVQLLRRVYVLLFSLALKVPGTAPKRLIANHNQLTMAPPSDEELAVLFKEFDTSGDGYISFQELMAALKKGGKEVDADQAIAIIAEVDENADGQIELSEFVKLFHLSPDKLPPGVRTIVDVSTFLLSPVTMLVKAASDVAGAVVQRL